MEGRLCGLQVLNPGAEPVECTEGEHGQLKIVHLRNHNGLSYWYIFRIRAGSIVDGQCDLPSIGGEGELFEIFTK